VKRQPLCIRVILMDTSRRLSDSQGLRLLLIHPRQSITHLTIREGRGIKGTQAVIDEYAPLYHVRSDAPPMLLITGDREKELLG